MDPFARRKWSYGLCQKNNISPIEQWALKKCETDAVAEEIMDERIKRVCLEIQENWTEKDRKKRCVYSNPPVTVHEMDCDRLLQRHQEEIQEEISD